MKRANRQRLDLWQDIVVLQSARPDLIAMIVGRDDPDLLAGIADGYVEIELLRSRRASRAYVRTLSLGRPLYADLCAAALDGRHGQALEGDDVGLRHRFHLHGAASLTGSHDVAVLFGPAADESAALPGLVPSPQARQQARDMLDVHRATLARWNADRLLADQRRAELIEKLEPERRSEVGAMLDATAGMQELQVPKPPSLDPLIQRLPRAIAFAPRTCDPSSISKLVEREVRRRPDSSAPPPADGCYSVVVAGDRPTTVLAVVSWVPHWGLPSYAEVRAAVEKTNPGAFRTPRLTGAHPPHFPDDTPSDRVVSARPAGTIEISDAVWNVLLEETTEPLLGDRTERAARARQRLRDDGFEALAWYQPHHLYDEEHWGLYLDSEGVDDLVLAVADDLLREGLGRNPLPVATVVVLGLIFEHELFHARVEAVLTWIELARTRPAYLPYAQNVYLPTRDEQGAVEEALANFWAWTWLISWISEGGLKPPLHEDDRLCIQRVVQALLDDSPAGYRDWRSGALRETWRQLGTSALRGSTRPLRSGIGLPVEGMIRGDLPITFGMRDIPLHPIGEGTAVRGLLAARATFNVPARAELQRALERVFNYAPVRGAGKGSHQKFEGPDGRMFPLPCRDPVSRTVFSAFLQHFGLTKSEYLAKIRGVL